MVKSFFIYLGVLVIFALRVSAQDTIRPKYEILSFARDTVTLFREIGESKHILISDLERVNKEKFSIFRTKQFKKELKQFDYYVNDFNDKLKTNLFDSLIFINITQINYKIKEFDNDTSSNKWVGIYQLKFSSIKSLDSAFYLLSRVDPNIFSGLAKLNIKFAKKGMYIYYIYSKYNNPSDKKVLKVFHLLFSTYKMKN